MSGTLNRMGFYDFMRAGHVKRWHIVNTTRDQTLAEHLYLVVLISLELYQYLTEIDLQETALSGEITDRPLPVRADGNKYHHYEQSMEILHLMMGAMFHDSTEIRQGDTPTPAKEFIKSMAGDTIFTKMEEHLLPEIPYIGGRLGPELRKIVGMADRIEAAHWITENKAGIHADMVAKGCWKKMVQMAVEYGWVPQVNRILQSLGMPYIYAEAMESAP